MVDKLLTGFDAPPATYLYIDKHMRDHGLFQAICRVNRLHGEDKEYGYVIDYKDLFKSLEQSIQDYTGEVFDGYDKEDVDGLLSNRLQKGRERLDDMLEQVKALCEPVAPPRDTKDYIAFFCSTDVDEADALYADALKELERKRVQLYKLVASLVRAYANLANDMDAAGYTAKEQAQIQQDVAHYENVRKEVKLASGDYVDMKLYEPSMRHLLDSYIRAQDSEVLTTFDDKTLVELIVDRGEQALELLPEGIRKNPEAVAETIENNVRRVILDDMALNPKYYQDMSELLDTLIRTRKQEAIHYQEYLKQIMDIVQRVGMPATSTDYPASINTLALRALYDNLEQNESLAIALDAAIRRNKSHNWVGHLQKERLLAKTVYTVLVDMNIPKPVPERVEGNKPKEGGMRYPTTPSKRSGTSAVRETSPPYNVSRPPTKQDEPEPGPEPEPEPDRESMRDVLVGKIMEIVKQQREYQ